MRISDWSSDVCSSDLDDLRRPARSSRRAHTRACRAARPGERVASQVEGSGWEQRRMGGDLRNLRGGVGASPESRGVRSDSAVPPRSEEHTSELQSLMRISYAVFCLKKKKTTQT